MLVEELLNSANGLSKQVAGSSLELEHALIMLLLLVGLLSIHGKYKRYVPWVIIGGVALSIFTPIHIIEPAWPIISAFFLPPLLWQAALRLSTTRPAFSWRSLLAWLLMIILIGFAHFGMKPINIKDVIPMIRKMYRCSCRWGDRANRPADNEACFRRQFFRYNNQ